MENNQPPKCLICLQPHQNLILLQQCKHTFCKTCIKGYIDTLKKYNNLTPQKLICLEQDCPKSLPDSLLQTIYPGQEGFILSVVRKRYLESKDPSVRIFNCKGFTKLNRQPLVDKPSSMGRDVHSKLMNQKVKSIIEGKTLIQDKKICTNISSFNKLNAKQKTVQCYVCGVSYCTQCQYFVHEGKCAIKVPEDQLTKYSKKNAYKKQSQTSTNIDEYLKANQMIKCLNPRCGLAIAKQEGCFWVKCRCSWQFCYPCEKLWGDCEHFSKYPYKKFVPPPQWMVKALNLY